MVKTFNTCLSVILFTRGGDLQYGVTSCLAAWPHVPFSRVSVQGGSLSKGVSIQGVSVGRPPRIRKRVVCILLECFLAENNRVDPEWVATHFQVTPLFSVKIVSLASSQSCCSIDGHAWCKPDPKSFLHYKSSFILERKPKRFYFPSLSH